MDDATNSDAAREPQVGPDAEGADKNDHAEAQADHLAANDTADLAADLPNAAAKTSA